MSFSVITSNGDVKSRTTVQRVTNLELQVESIKEDCAAHRARIRERLGDHEFFVEVEDGEVHPVNTGHERELDEAYQEEFETVVNDENLNEADEDFLTTLNLTRLWLCHTPEQKQSLAGWLKGCETRMDSQLEQQMTTQFWTPECMRWSFLMVIKHHSLSMQLQVTSLPKLMTKASNTVCLMKLLDTEQQ